MVHYPVPIHRQPAYDDRLPSDDLSETEAAAQQILSLAMYPELTEEGVDTLDRLRGKHLAKNEIPPLR
jgi:dTDP-4-amino-4,6-dideoxygalactose transaminase